MNLISRPIRFTNEVDAWRRILDALGGALLTDDHGWVVYQLGSGRLALHAASEEDPAGSSMLCFETEQSLGDVASAASGAGAPVEVRELDHGISVEVNGVFHATVDQATPGDAVASQPELSVLGIWYGADTAGARTLLEQLGLKARVVADNGAWTDFSCDGGGLMAVHSGATPGTELGLEWNGDVEDALALLKSAGIDAELIDETYGRTVHIPDPDGGRSIWLSEVQTDLYGYTLSCE
ncbi:MAG: hypothetical protein Q4G35_07005 [Propionibacteriaceae bacterium]|nr:hypothetical protein [Propionibacteriaceae bacterium]